MKSFGVSMPSSREAQYSASRCRSQPCPMVASSRNCDWYFTAFLSRSWRILSVEFGSSIALTQATESTDSGWTVSVRPNKKILEQKQNTMFKVHQTDYYVKSHSLINQIISWLSSKIKLKYWNRWNKMIKNKSYVEYNALKYEIHHCSVLLALNNKSLKGLESMHKAPTCLWRVHMFWGIPCAVCSKPTVNSSVKRNLQCGWMNDLIVKGHIFATILQKQTHILSLLLTWMNPSGLTLHFFMIPLPYGVLVTRRSRSEV